MIITDASRKIIIANQTAEKMFGYAVGLLRGVVIEELVPEANREPLLREWGELMRDPATGTSAASREIEAARKDGSVFPVELTRNVFETPGGSYVLGVVRDITARRKLENSLRESEKHNRTLMDSLADGVFVAQEFRFVFANPALITMLGYSPEEFIGLPFAKVVAPEYLELWVERFTQRVGTGPEPPSTYEVRFLRKDGGSIVVELRASRVRFKGSMAALGIVRDTTEQRRAEDARNELQAYFRAIFEATPDGIIVADSGGKIVMANPSTEKMFGYPEGSLVGQSVELLIPALLQPRLARERTELMSDPGGSPVGQLRQVEGRKNDSSMFAVEFIRSAFSAPRGILVLDEARAQMVAIVESSDDAIIGKNLDGIVLSWNRGAEKIFGYAAEEMTGQSILRVVPQEREHEETEILSRIGRGETTEHFETVRKRKDGRLIDVSVTVSPIRDAAGNIIGASKIARDITQTKLLEAQLRQSQKMEAIGMLASGIAHDFNNILGAILGNVELAREDLGDNAQAKESLEEIRKAGSRARDLVRQIVAFGRRQPPTRVVIALAPLVEESVRLLRATLPARVSIQGNYAEDAPNILADATQIQQILLNLGTNAAHAMQGQRGRIDVGVGAVVLGESATTPHADLLPGSYARIVVTDTGHGMDEETRRRIFEPFFTTKAEGEGTGLGMYAVQGIMRDHEGAIMVHSEPGKGSSFELFFPDARAEAVAEAHPAAGDDVQGKGQRVLYIDDDDAMVFLVTRMLQRRGYRVSGFTDALQGLKALREDPAAFDLALTDHNMPAMSGVDVAREIRDIRPDLPVALASGYITDGLRAEAAEAGVRDIIFKPNVVEDFCDVVHNLAQSSARSQRSA
jgi:PAS domain S-box-containing protein